MKPPLFTGSSRPSGSKPKSLQEHSGGREMAKMTKQVCNMVIICVLISAAVIMTASSLPLDAPCCPPC